MAARSTIGVAGLKDCEAALEELINTLGASRATGLNTVRRALRYAAVPVAATANARAPVGDRNVYSKRLNRVLTPGKLQRIRISSRTTPRQRRRTPKESTVEIYVGPAAWPHAHLVEFGTAHAAPRPFLRDAVDSNIGNVTSRFVSRLKEEIEKAAKRARSKQARLIATMKAK